MNQVYIHGDLNDSKTHIKQRQKNQQNVRISIKTYAMRCKHLVISNKTSYLD